MSTEFIIVAGDPPQFGSEHETGAVFLGRFDLRERGRVIPCDLWYYPNDFLGPTVVSRWGPRGADYSSGMVFGWTGRSPDLVEARRRAERLGLDCERERYHPGNRPQSGDVVHWGGLPWLFCGERRDGASLRRFSDDHPNGCGDYVTAPFAEVTDLDGQPIRWVSTLLL